MVEVFVFVHVYKHVFILEKQVNQLKSSVQAAGDGGIVTVLGGSIHHPYATPIPHTIYAFLNSK